MAGEGICVCKASCDCTDGSFSDLTHACGHDGHTAMLLAAARHLAEQGRFDGTLHLIFQPAEEGGGGTLRMMEDGLFERYPCDAVFAMHNMPGVPQGRLLLRDGALMASSDYATVTSYGVTAELRWKRGYPVLVNSRPRRRSRATSPSSWSAPTG